MFYLFVHRYKGRLPARFGNPRDSSTSSLLAVVSYICGVLNLVTARTEAVNTANEYICLPVSPGH